MKKFKLLLLTGSLLVMNACGNDTKSPIEASNEEILSEFEASSSILASSSSSEISSVQWTDSIITDFGLADIVGNSDWRISTWGNDNRSHSADNVWIENGALNLKVNGGTSLGETTTGAEIVSQKQQFLYGSYRVELKATKEPGTVTGFFYYLDDSNEIDIEFLSQDQNETYFTIHENTGPNSHKQMTLPFDPTEGFHEYRFDWSPTQVIFYVDGTLMTTLDSNVPDKVGSILINHWTLSNADWGGGPPIKDAIIQIKKISMYFNL